MKLDGNSLTLAKKDLEYLKELGFEFSMNYF